jgi:hypothetical protein
VAVPPQQVLFGLIPNEFVIIASRNWRHYQHGFDL